MINDLLDNIELSIDSLTKEELEVLVKRLDSIKSKSETSLNQLDDRIIDTETVLKNVFEAPLSENELFDGDLECYEDMCKSCKNVLDNYLNSALSYYITLGQVVLGYREVDTYHNCSKDLWETINGGRAFNRKNFFRFIRKCFDECKNNKKFNQYGDSYECYSKLLKENNC